MSTILPIIGKAAVTIGIQVAKKGIDYASKAYGGYAGISVLNNIVENSKNQGEQVAGKVGGAFGKFLGKAVAGHAVPIISQQVKVIGETIQQAGVQALDIALQKEETKEPADKKPSKALSTALEVGKIAATVVGTAAIASGIAPVAGIGVAYAAVDALPKIIKAALADTKEEEVQDLGDILSSAAKKVCIEAAGVAIGNVVRYDQIQGAYNTRVAQGALAGKKIGSYLPGFMKGTAEKVGAFFGTVDAGRHAMSTEVIQQANDAAATAEQVVKGGLKMTDAFVSAQVEKQENNTLGTLKKVAWISAGVAGGVALTVIAPEIAPVITATSLLSVSDKIVSWAKNKYFGKEAAAETKVEEAAEEVAAIYEKPFEKEILDAKESLIRQVKIDIEKMELNQAAPAA